MHGTSDRKKPAPKENTHLLLQSKRRHLQKHLRLCPFHARFVRLSAQLENVRCPLIDLVGSGGCAPLGGGGFLAFSLDLRPKRDKQGETGALRDRGIRGVPSTIYYLQ